MKKIIFILIISILFFGGNSSTKAEATGGDNDILVILVNYQNTEGLDYMYGDVTREVAYDLVFDSETSVKNFYYENSYGKINLMGDIFPSVGYENDWYELNINLTCSPITVVEKAMQAIVENEPNIDINFLDYEHVVAIVPKDESGNCYRGAAYVGQMSVLTPDGRKNMTVAYVEDNTMFSPYGIAHELGHGLGVYHAGMYDCGIFPYNSSGCEIRTAHDLFSIMSFAVTSPGQFTSPHKDIIGLFDEDYKLIEITKDNISTDGVYELTPYESMEPGIKALKVLRKNGKYWYMEFRQPIGFDERAAGGSADYEAIRIYSNDSTSRDPNSILVKASGPSAHWGNAGLKADTPEPHTGTTGFFDPVDKIKIEVVSINIDQENPVDSRAEVKIIFSEDTVVNPPEDPDPEQTFCGDYIRQRPNQKKLGGPDNDGHEECDDGPSGSDSCTASCVDINFIEVKEELEDSESPKYVVLPKGSQEINDLAESQKNLDFRGPNLPVTKVDINLTNRLIGRILLQVEDHGEAWYINPDNGKRMYMKDGSVAYSMMRNLGLGISNADLSKIPIGFEDRFECLDSDGDGLCNKLEDGLGTDKFDRDSDGDGYDDGTEVKGNYNPNGQGSMNYDNALANRLKGKILLQVQAHGEAWYINPEDGKRYYMPDGPSAYQIMRYLSLGITNADLSKIDK